MWCEGLFCGLKKLSRRETWTCGTFWEIRHSWSQQGTWRPWSSCRFLIKNKRQRMETFFRQYTRLEFFFFTFRLTTWLTFANMQYICMVFFIWAKYEEIRNFTTVIPFLVFTGICSETFVISQSEATYFVGCFWGWLPNRFDRKWIEYTCNEVFSLGSVLLNAEIAFFT